MPSPYGDCEPSQDYVRTKCLAECEAEYIINNCSCKDIHMPGENVICCRFSFSSELSVTVRKNKYVL